MDNHHKLASPLQEGLTIIIPAFNEEATIQRVISKIRSLADHFLFDSIIIVDDGSTDDTARLAEEAGARVIRHGRNKGYGAAIKTGISLAKTEYILTMDADDQHNPENILSLWDMRKGSDMVVGQRMQLIHSPLWRMPGKWLLGAMANYITRQTIPDLNSGFRLIRRDIALKYLHLCPSGFSLSTTLTVTLHSRGYDVSYVPIQVNKRVGNSTVSISTGLDTLILILRIATMFQPLRIFIPLSIVIGAFGVIWGMPIALSGRGVSVGAMLALVTAILLFVLGLLSDQISQLRLERFE